MINAVQKLKQINPQLQQKEEFLVATLQEMKAENELLKQSINSK